MNTNDTQTNDRLSHALKWKPKPRPSKLKQWRAFIYLIQDGEFYKLGIATNAETRLYQLQVGNPRELKLLRYWTAERAPEIEERLHAAFSKYQVRGEWFQLPDPVVFALLSAETAEELLA